LPDWSDGTLPPRHGCCSICRPWASCTITARPPRHVERPLLPMPATPAADSLRLVQALQKQWGAALIETHISWVLLDGEHAWKIKKPVRLPFLNASELDTRLQLCEAECRLNRRLAPSVYLGVVPLRGTPGSPRLTGEGAVIEYALKMRQFPPGALLSEHLAEGRLLPAHIDALAHRLARFHQEALVAPPGAPFGTPELIELQIRRVIEGLAPQDGGQAAHGLARDLVAAARPGPHRRGPWRPAPGQHGGAW